MYCDKCLAEKRDLCICKPGVSHDQLKESYAALRDNFVELAKDNMKYIKEIEYLKEKIEFIEQEKTIAL